MNRSRIKITSKTKSLTRIKETNLLRKKIARMTSMLIKVKEALKKKALVRIEIEINRAKKKISINLKIIEVHTIEVLIGVKRKTITIFKEAPRISILAINLIKGMTINLREEDTRKSLIETLIMRTNIVLKLDL